jgi:4-hydroxy-tetrahydrodipicolinate reductase
MKKVKIAILGLGGRMGTEIQKLLEDLRYSNRFEIGMAPRTGESLDGFFGAELWIEFSSPAATLVLVREAIRRNSEIPLLVGATGWSEVELRELEEAAKVFPILRAANFSLGILICRMTLQAWRAYPELSNWKVSIRDLHHAAKKDAPSGTALALQEALGRAASITSVREGDAVGTHEITFESGSEKLTIIHEAKSRRVFAEGALEAAIRLFNSDAATLPKRLLSLEDLYLHRGA